MQTLVLGLGNELLADDAIGILAARELKTKLNGRVDVVESSLSGVNLLETFIGYKRAVIIDAIQTGNAVPGTIHHLSLESLDRVYAPSPHYAGLPEMVTIAQKLDLEFPEEIAILAIEVEDPLTIGGGLSPAVEQALPDLIEQILDQISRWDTSHQPA